MAGGKKAAAATSAKLSPDQLEEYKASFALIDKDGSGTIEVAELSNFFKKLGRAPTDAQIKAMIAKTDIDGDGKIDFDEFCAMMSRRDKFVTFETELRDAFSVFDKDGNGSISASELLKTMIALGETLSEDQIKLMIKEADMDGDGQMDFNEFVRIMMY